MGDGEREETRAGESAAVQAGTRARPGGLHGKPWVTVGRATLGRWPLAPESSSSTAAAASAPAAPTFSRASTATHVSPSSPRRGPVSSVLRTDAGAGRGVGLVRTDPGTPPGSPGAGAGPRPGGRRGTGHGPRRPASLHSCGLPSTRRSARSLLPMVRSEPVTIPRCDTLVRARSGVWTGLSGRDGRPARPRCGGLRSR